MHNKFYIHFFSCWWNVVAGNLALIIKKSVLTSISFFGEICISLNVKYVDLSSEVGWSWLAIPFSFHFMLNWSGLSISFSTSCTAFQLSFLLAFFRLFSFHLGLFFVCLGPKFNLSRDDYIFLLNLSCHIAPVCNLPVRGTASFNNLLQVLQLSLHQKYKNLWAFG